MKLCAISSKECWREGSGWSSYGGFPLQMAAIAELFESAELLIVEGRKRSGGLGLPREAVIVPMREPRGSDTIRKIWLLARLPYYLATIVRHVRGADAVHVPLPGDIPLLGMLVALALRKKLLVRYGGSWRANSQTTMMNRVTRGLMRMTAGGRNVMLATGYEASPPAPGVEWIFSTSLTETELARIQPRLDRGCESPARFVYAGRLSREKGLDVLIHALEMLRDAGFQPLPEVTLLGDGPDGGRLRAMAGKLVRFAGQVDRETLSRYFLEADVCVQPSLTEGFSKAWLDAMAHGVPVLASRVGAASGVIGGDGERGWMVPPGDAGALAGMIQRILSEETNWPGLRRRCREHAEQLTLERWQAAIAKACASGWGCRFEHNRLIAEAV